MLWFFERSGERLQCEIHAASDGTGVELVWTLKEERHVEHFADAREAELRRKQLEATLRSDGWKRIGRVTPPPKRFL